MEPKLSISNVYKSFGEKKVLQNLSIDVKKGESLVIIGGSGTGKSVLLKCVLGLLKADSGSIKVDGVEVVGESGKAQRKRLLDIGMVFQGSALFDSLTVWENVAFGLMYEKKVSRTKAKKKALSLLAQVGLDKRVGELYPSEISGGMQRRVALARAVSTEPSLIFFDEPTAGLDPIFCGVINNLIESCVKKLGATAVTITHDMACATHVGDKIAMIHEGHIIWHGKASSIKTCKNPYVQQFIQGRADGPIKLETTTAEVA